MNVATKGTAGSQAPLAPSGQLTALKHVGRLQYGDALPSDARLDSGIVPVFGSNGRVGTHNQANTRAPVIIVGRKGSHGKVVFSDVPVHAIDTTYFVDERSSRADLRWLYWALQTLDLDGSSQDTGVPGLSREYAHNQRLSVPPLEGPPGVPRRRRRRGPQNEAALPAAAGFRWAGGGTRRCKRWRQSAREEKAGTLIGLRRNHAADDCDGRYRPALLRHPCPQLRARCLAARRYGAHCHNRHPARACPVGSTRAKLAILARAWCASARSLRQTMNTPCAYSAKRADRAGTDKQKKNEASSPVYHVRHL